VCVQGHELRIIEAGQDKKRFCTIANHKLPAHIHTSTKQPDVLNNNKQFYTNPTTLYQSAHPRQSASATETGASVCISYKFNFCQG